MATPTVTIIQDDYKVTIRVDMDIDITGYTEIYLYFRRPDKTQVSKISADSVAVFGADADGVLEWETEADFFLDHQGTWKVQPRAEGSNWRYTGRPAAKFTVEGLFVS